MNKRFLIIRRDNIGDLVCTTPAIHTLREAFPDAKIAVLVNTYNADVISNNPDVDQVYVYEKAKHAPEKTRIAVWLSNVRVLWQIRKEKYDVAIGCASISSRLAQYTYMTGASVRIGYAAMPRRRNRRYTISMDEPCGDLHEVERTAGLFRSLCPGGRPEKMKIIPFAGEVYRIGAALKGVRGERSKRPLIAFHISSRKPENRWPVSKFIGLGIRVQTELDTDILLLWSPGSRDNVFHPGDDEKAEEILKSVHPRPIDYKTTRLCELVAALSLVDLVVCGDGGAMHIAAGLGKPVVAIWGSTDRTRWYPWRTDHVIVGKDTRVAEDVDEQSVLEGIKSLL